jgi:hypothetical protein
VLVAAAGLAAATRGATLGRVAALVAVALALLLAGAILDGLARAAGPAADPPAASAWPRQGGRVTPDALLRSHPRATLGWLRGRLGLSQEAFAARLGTSWETMAGWERLGRAIAPHHHRRLVALLATHLATPEGEAFVRAIGRGEAAGGEEG